MKPFAEIGTLQYLGCKSRILEHICKPIAGNNDITKVIDLFAGTGSIGYALKEHKKIISNDIEYYAYVINQAILNGCLLSCDEEQSFWDDVDQYYRTISNAINDTISTENSFFNSAVDYHEYRIFCENTPSVFFPQSDDIRFNSLKKIVSAITPGERQNADYPCLFITYYANAYFGINQCAQIDAVCGAIQNEKDARKKYVLLSALMSIMSETASTTAHFAQFLKVKNQATCKNLIEKRKTDIILGMRQYITEFRNNGILNKKEGSVDCYNLDYIECLNQISIDSSTLVYADPPYFKEHYSRYYHVLNTLCLYDYPSMSINPQTHTYSVGRYRVGRSISNFGKKAMALEAFNSLIDLCANKGAWLMLSYADNSIVDIDDLRRIIEINYDVRIKKIELNHSKQGRSSTSKVDEYLFLCRPKESLLTIGEKLFEIRELKPIVDNPAGFMHNYMARKPYNTISAIIENFCPENGTVYDPMFGSGTTLIEASKLGRKAIGTDINPIAYKLCKASLTKWDIEKVYFLIDSFCAEVKNSCEHLYVFNCIGEKRIIERCHFNQIDNMLIPTMYWYKTFNNGKLTGRKKAVVDNEFISWYKSFEGSPIFNVENKPLIPNSRIAISTHYTVFTYFCNRNVIALDNIMGVLKKHTDEYGYEILELIVSSALNLIKLSDKKASSQMPYWLPKINVTSRNATIIIEEKVKVFKEALVYLRDNCKLYAEEGFTDDKKIIVRNVAAQTISYSDLANNSVDLVLTDPPYTDQVPYLEYSQLWNKVLSWNGMTEEALQSELVVSDAPSRKKDINDFNFTFSQIIKRTSDSIKIGGYFIMFYHSFNLKSWSHILALMNVHGLSYCYQMPVSTPRKSFKTVMSPKGTLNGHYIVVFQKNDSIENKVFLGTLEDAKKRAINCAREIIESHNDVTTQDLYDGGMLKEAFEEGYLAILAEKYSSLIDVISNEFDNTDGIWREK